MDELLAVLEDARLVGDVGAVELLSTQLAKQLGVVEIGADNFGVWLRFEVVGQEDEPVSCRMRWCWPGRFLMGSPRGRQGCQGTGKGSQSNAVPRHPVVLTNGFWLGEVPVTQALWQAVMGENPSRFVSSSRPVERLSWHACQQFCERLQGQVGVLFPSLPTEAQWEYAARAGSQLPWYGRPNDVAWYWFNSAENFELPRYKKGTHPVGQKQPNAWGFYDMLGNINEWCQDSNMYDSEQHQLAPYKAGEQFNPLCTKGSRRIVRGGSWSSAASGMQAASRYADLPRNRRYGMRLVCDFAHSE